MRRGAAAWVLYSQRRSQRNAFFALSKIRFGGSALPCRFFAYEVSNPYGLLSREEVMGMELSAYQES